MELVPLGTGPLRVSRLCIGTMTFGEQCDEATSAAILDAAAAAGVNVIDTADVYPARARPGQAEEHVGRWLRGRRDDFVVATKCGSPAGPRHPDAGCSAAHITASLEDSLRRLGTDHVDLYQLHRFDPATPVEESLRALDALVQAGKVRAIGVSNWTAEQVADAQHLAADLGLVRITSVQPRYNLLHRAPEGTLLPQCAHDGTAVLPYNPLAGGLLSGKHRPSAPPDAGTRFDRSPVYRDLYWKAQQFATVEAVAALARDAGLPLATLAVAWSIARPVITSAIIGASRPEQLADTLAGAARPLDADLLDALDRASRVHLDGPAL